MAILTLLLILFFCLTALSFIYGDRQNEHFTILLFVGLFTVVSSCLVDKDILPDYEQYVSYFQIAKSDIIFLEPSFVLISHIVDVVFGNNVFWGFSIYLFLGISLKIFAIKRLTNLYILSFAFYIASYWIYHEMIQIRAGVAAAFFLMALKPLYERNIKLFLLYSLLSISFHYSAIIILPLWFVSGKLTNRIFYMWLIPGCMLLYLLHVDFISVIRLLPISYIQNKLDTYTAVAQIGSDRGLITAAEYNPFISWYLIKAVIALLMWFFIKRISVYNHFAVLLLKIYTIGIALLWCFPSIPVAATRCSEFLSAVQIILIPLFAYAVKQRRLFYTISILYGIAWIYWNASSFLFNA